MKFKTTVNSSLGAWESDWSIDFQDNTELNNVQDLLKDMGNLSNLHLVCDGGKKYIFFAPEVIKNSIVEIEVKL
jgi:hypothetical protein